MSYQIGEHFWIPDDEHAWLYGALTEFKNSVLEFNTPKGVKKFRVNDLKAKLEPCGSHVNDLVENLVDLDELSEGAILHHIRNRFAKKQIYTHVGSILVAVNPFENLNIYGERDIRKAFESSAPYPHVFVTAATAYQQLRTNEKNQSVLISGESGAGKTETTKKVLTFLANVAPDSKPKSVGEPGMETKILQSNPLLEALGNAKTLRNNNSSRFGKWMKVGFDKSFRIQGCEIINYLLEKSRIVFQSTNERNYHIFYQIIAGADPAMKQRLYLKPAGDFNYLNQSGCLRIEGVDDAQEFRDVMEAMATLQFSSSTVESIFKIMAGILHLGNVKFETNTSSDNCKITAATDDSVRMCSELFGIDLPLLRYALVEKKMQMSRRGSVVSIALSPTQAEDSRDTIAKTLYSNLFDWVVQRVNSTLRTDDPPFSIGILDIFGFEVFEHNSFEQLCINYANEKLQYHFNDVIFSVERQMYEEEGISLDNVQFEDNSECVNLIEGKPFGLISLLEEECNLGNNGSDLGYINKLEKNFGTGKPAANKYFIKHKTKPDYFSVAHFAGAVEYCVTGFLDKNRDTLSNTCRETMISSQIPLISELFVERPTDGSSAGGSTAASAGGGGGKQSQQQKQSTKSTLGTQFRNQLIGLLTTLRTTEPHFIRCVKPNHQKVANILDGVLALRQMRYAGLFEAIRIRKSGYAYRVPFAIFANTYQILVDGLSKRRQQRKIEDKDACWAILQHCSAQNWLDRSVWQVGQRSRIFLKNASDRSVLERIRTQRIMVFVLRIQAAARAFLKRLSSQKEHREALAKQRKIEELQRKMMIAVVKIQKHWRRKLVQLSFQSMSNLIELRRVLARREIHKIRELLGRIEQDFLNTPHLLMSENKKMNRLMSPSAGSPSRSAGKLKASNDAFSMDANSLAAGSIARDPQVMMISLFEHEIKVARVMLKLIEVQDQLIEDLHKAMDGSNVMELNRLILKAERFEMNSHPLVIEAKELLVKLFNKRRVMKQLLNFLQNEDEFHETVMDTIEEAKTLDIDTEFLDKVVTVYENAGPRLKTRNRLRQAIETVNRYLIEQGCLEVMDIREHNHHFAEAELRAAKMMLRLLQFDYQLYPDLGSNRCMVFTSGVASSSSKVLVDASELPETVCDELPPGVEPSLMMGNNNNVHVKKLWGEPILAEPCPSKLSPEVIEICNAISEATYPAIAKMHKQRLQQMLSGKGSSDDLYAVIRYFKWTKTLCTWKFPEVTGDSNASQTTPLSKTNRSDAAASELVMSANATFGRSQNTGEGTNPMSPNNNDDKKLKLFASVAEERRRQRQQGKDVSSTATGADEEEFFGLRLREARSNVHIIRSLHQDFDASLYQTGSAAMEAAVSSAKLSASVQDTLQHLNHMASIDMDIVLPNGMVFNKTVQRRPGMPMSTLQVTASTSPLRQAAAAKSGLNITLTSSPTTRTRPNANNTTGMMGESRSRQVISAAWTTMADDPFATSQRDQRKGPLPTVPIKRVEELDDKNPEKLLYMSRKNRSAELKKIETDLHRLKRSQKPAGWK
jgi:myosin heavy subunit